MNIDDKIKNRQNKIVNSQFILQILISKEFKFYFYCSKNKIKFY